MVDAGEISDGDERQAQDPRLLRTTAAPMRVADWVNRPVIYSPAAIYARMMHEFISRGRDRHEIEPVERESFDAWVQVEADAMHRRAPPREHPDMIVHDITLNNIGFHFGDVLQKLRNQDTQDARPRDQWTARKAPWGVDSGLREKRAAEVEAAQEAARQAELETGPFAVMTKAIPNRATAAQGMPSSISTPRPIVGPSVRRNVFGIYRTEPAFLMERQAEAARREQAAKLEKTEATKTAAAADAKKQKQNQQELLGEKSKRKGRVQVVDEQNLNPDSGPPKDAGPRTRAAQSAINAAAQTERPQGAGRAHNQDVLPQEEDIWSISEDDGPEPEWRTRQPPLPTQFRENSFIPTKDEWDWSFLAKAQYDALPKAKIDALKADYKKTHVWSNNDSWFTISREIMKKKFKIPKDREVKEFWLKNHHARVVVKFFKEEADRAAAAANADAPDEKMDAESPDDAAGISMSRKPSRKQDDGTREGTRDASGTASVIDQPQEKSTRRTRQFSAVLHPELSRLESVSAAAIPQTKGAGRAQRGSAAPRNHATKPPKAVIARAAKVPTLTSHKRNRKDEDESEKEDTDDDQPQHKRVRRGKVPKARAEKPASKDYGAVGPNFRPAKQKKSKMVILPYKGSFPPTPKKKATPLPKARVAAESSVANDEGDEEMTE